MTPDKVEEIIGKFESAFGNSYLPEENQDYQGWLRTTLTQYHQDLMREVVENLNKIYEEELVELSESNNQPSTKEYIKKGLAVYQEQIIKSLNK